MLKKKHFKPASGEERLLFLAAPLRNYHSLLVTLLNSCCVLRKADLGFRAPMNSRLPSETLLASLLSGILSSDPEMKTRQGGPREREGVQRSYHRLTHIIFLHHKCND